MLIIQTLELIKNTFCAKFEGNIFILCKKKTGLFSADNLHVLFVILL